VTQPAPDDTSSTGEYTPTREDLRAVVDFLRKRSLDEAGAAGSMDFYRENGVTVRVTIPKAAFANGTHDGHRKKYVGWMDEHSPDRFVDMAHQLANLADALASAGVDATYDSRGPDPVGAYRARAAWRALTKAARLWDKHPDLLPLWAKGEDE
jgi:hypothetical protein